MPACCASWRAACKSCGSLLVRILHLCNFLRTPIAPKSRPLAPEGPAPNRRPHAFFPRFCCPKLHKNSCVVSFNSARRPPVTPRLTAAAAAAATRHPVPLPPAAAARLQMIDDTLVPRQLFGGAASLWLPQRFADISDFRPIPDHQEVGAAGGGRRADGEAWCAVLLLPVERHQAGMLPRRLLQPWTHVIGASPAAHVPRCLLMQTWISRWWSR